MLAYFQVQQYTVRKGDSITLRAIVHKDKEETKVETAGLSSAITFRKANLQRLEATDVPGNFDGIDSTDY